MKNIRSRGYRLLSGLAVCWAVSGSFSWTVPLARADGEAAGLSILYIGDSHSAGTFGHTVDQTLRSRLPQSKIWFYAASSATPDYYFSGTSSHGGFYQHPAIGPVVGSTAAVPEVATPGLPGLLDKTHAAFTVVALSTNLLKITLDVAKAQVTRTIQAIKDKGSQCIWVGGPDERFVSRPIQAAMYEMLATVTHDMGCPLIDSRKYTHYPDVGGGGIHYDDIVVTMRNGQRSNVGVTMATEWGLKVVADILAIVAPGAGPGENSAQSKLLSP